MPGIIKGKFFQKLPKIFGQNLMRKIAKEKKGCKKRKAQVNLSRSGCSMQTVEKEKGKTLRKKLPYSPRFFCPTVCRQRRKNRIWFDPVLTNGKVTPNCFQDGMKKEDLQKIGVGIDTIKPSELSPELQQKIQEARQELMKAQHPRLVLVDTDEFKAFILRVNPHTQNLAIKDEPSINTLFLNILEDNVKKFGFTYTSEYQTQVLEKFADNIRTNQHNHNN